MSLRRSTAANHQASPTTRSAVDDAVRDILTDQEMRLVELWRSTHPLRHCLRVVLGMLAYPFYFLGVFILCTLALVFCTKIFAYSFGLFDENIKPRDT